MTPKLLLIMGPAGAGKSTVIQCLQALDSRFVYISPYMTRSLRPGETDKISILPAELERMEMNGEFVAVNELYGVKYATPRGSIGDALQHGRFPVIDWPISRVAVMTVEFPNRLVRAYLRPPTADILSERLSSRQASDLSIRMSAATLELEQLDRGDFDSTIDIVIVTKTGDQARVAALIREHFLQACASDQDQSMQPK